MSTTLARTWRRRIAAHDAGQPITKPHIYAFRKLWANSRNLAPELLADIQALCDRGIAWQITPEQTVQGLNWLKSRKAQKQLTESQRAIVDDFSHFLFVDVREYSIGYGRSIFTPAYRVCSNRGPWFDYTATTWQDGSVLEVL